MIHYINYPGPGGDLRVYETAYGARENAEWALASLREQNPDRYGEAFVESVDRDGNRYR